MATQGTFEIRRDGDAIALSLRDESGEVFYTRWLYEDDDTYALWEDLA